MRLQGDLERRYVLELLFDAQHSALKSAQIRERCWGRNHPMVANAYEALAKVRVALLKRFELKEYEETAVQALTACVYIRKACGLSYVSDWSAAGETPDRTPLVLIASSGHGVKGCNGVGL